MPDAVRGAQVRPERRLPVGTCRNEVEPAAGGEDAPAEASYGVSALVLERHRRHRDKDVIGQEDHERVEICGLVRADEPRHDRVRG